MVERRNVWISVYPHPLIRDRHIDDIKRLFDCYLPPEIEKELFITDDMIAIGRNKKVYNGWGDFKKMVGYVIGFKKKRGGKFEAFISVNENLASDAVRKEARIDVTKDADTKEITFHGIQLG